MISESETIKFFEYFYRKITNNELFSLTYTDKDKKTTQNFIKKVQKKYGDGIGFDWLFFYFSFQFMYWDEKRTKLGKRRVYFNWIIGNKALKRFIEKDNNQIYFSELFCRQYEIKKGDLIKTEQKTHTDISKREEEEKERFYGNTEGFLNCIENTTFYNRKSKFCFSCLFKNSCIGLLKINLPKIYAERTLRKV